MYRVNYNGQVSNTFSTLREARRELAQQLEYDIRHRQAHCGVIQREVGPGEWVRVKD